MAGHWELQPEQKRGVFNLVPHRPLYGLIHWTDSRNELPSSPTRALTEQADLQREVPALRDQRDRIHPTLARRQLGFRDEERVVAPRSGLHAHAVWT